VAHDATTETGAEMEQNSVTHEQAAQEHDEAAAHHRVCLAALATTNAMLYEYVANEAAIRSANAAEASEDATGETGPAHDAAQQAWGYDEEGKHAEAIEAHEAAAKAHREAQNAA
jgi:hypothetical protein